MISNKYVEVHMHLTINGPKLKKSLDIAIKTIYADIKKMFEMSYGAFFQSVHIAGDEDGERTLIVWKLEDIVNMDQLFLSVLEDAIAKRYKISVKYMQRTKISSEELYSIDKGRKPADALFGTRYMPTWKTYHFHFVSSEKDDDYVTFSYFPLVCLLQGVFLDPEAACRYARFHYREGENLLENWAYKAYLVEQVYSLKYPWESQDIPTCLWTLFYLLILEEDRPESRLLLNEVYRMMAILPACLKSISKMLLMVRDLMQAGVDFKVEDFKQGARTELRQTLVYLEELRMNCKLLLNQSTTLKASTCGIQSTRLSSASIGLWSTPTQATTRSCSWSRGRLASLMWLPRATSRSSSITLARCSNTS